MQPKNLIALMFTDSRYTPHNYTNNILNPATPRNSVRMDTAGHHGMEGNKTSHRLIRDNSVVRPRCGRPSIQQAQKEPGSRGDHLLPPAEEHGKEARLPHIISSNDSRSSDHDSKNKLTPTA